MLALLEGVTGYTLVNLPDGTASTLPAGLTLNPTTGVISGIPCMPVKATSGIGTITEIMLTNRRPRGSRSPARGLQH